MATTSTVNISELDIHEIGAWPLEYKIASLIAVGIVSIALVYFVILKNSIAKLSSLQSGQQRLRAEFVDDYQQSINLEAYKIQMNEIQKILQKILQKLPSKGEIPSLLEDISQQALSAGLTFEVIRPQEPVDKGFYYEQPIKMVLVGKYHGFGNFTAGLSKLPRIVTLHNFTIQSQQDKTITIEIYAKTYWYVSKEQL